MGNPKQRILDYLKKNKKTSITKLRDEIRVEYYRLQVLLNELDREGKIKLITHKSYTYAELI